MQGLARAGATVQGIDASAENIAAASAHARIDPDIESNTVYRQVLVEDLAEELEHGVAASGRGAEASGTPLFDVVVSSEVIEHVNEPKSFVQAAARCVRPGGAMMMTTIDRTALSYLGAIFAAEQLAGLVPPGTHDYAKLVRPSELREWMQQAGLTPQKPVPLFYNPLTGLWAVHGTRVAMQYAMIAKKAEAGVSP
jgi:ubiquinone biosynthesis O-methyltransferase